jgi:hypothetical protein
MSEATPKRRPGWLNNPFFKLFAYTVVASFFIAPPYFLDHSLSDLPRSVAATVVILATYGFFTICLYANEAAAMSAASLYGVPLGTIPFSLIGLLTRRSRRKTSVPTGRRIIFNAAFGYFCTIYAFALTYRFLSKSDSEAFHEAIPDFITSLYFSIVTIATVGYGDIVPKNWPAKLLVSAEVLIGVAYSIFFFSIIAGFIKESRSRQHDSPNNETT